MCWTLTPRSATGKQKASICHGYSAKQKNPKIVSVFFASTNKITVWTTRLITGSSNSPNLRSLTVQGFALNSISGTQIESSAGCYPTRSFVGEEQRCCPTTASTLNSTAVPDKALVLGLLRVSPSKSRATPTIMSAKGFQAED